MPKKADDDKDRIQEAIDLGADELSGLLGAGVGLAFAGPGGAVAGAAAAPIASRLMKATGGYLRGKVSRRGEVRLGAFYVLTQMAINEQINRGRTLRTDGFFDEDLSGRAPVDEAVEALLRAAEEEFQERKLPYMSRLLAEVAVNPAIDRDTAATLVRQAHELTYRQILLLVMFGRSQEFKLREYSLQPVNSGDEIIPLLTEISDLAQRGLAAIRGDTVVPPTDAIPSVVEPFGLGTWLYGAMELGSSSGQT